MRKGYILDTNILVEDHKCVENLKNGIENEIYIPNTAIEELDKLKDKKPQLKPRIFSILEELEKYKDDIKILYADGEKLKEADNQILKEIEQNLFSINNPVFITIDKILRFKAYQRGLTVEPYKRQITFKHESENYTGFFDNSEDEKINNCFY